MAQDFLEAEKEWIKDGRPQTGPGSENYGEAQFLIEERELHDLVDDLEELAEGSSREPARPDTIDDAIDQVAVEEVIEDVSVFKNLSDDEILAAREFLDGQKVYEKELAELDSEIAARGLTGEKVKFVEVPARFDELDPYTCS